MEKNNEIEVTEPTNNLTSLVASTPEEMINNATKYATQLGRVIKERKLYTQIGGKNHVNIEGWSTLGTLLGVLPFIEWSRRCEGNNETDIAYEARCVLKSMSGQVVGSGEAMAAKSEGTPWGKNMFSIRSMAETRATGKAFRLSFAWIMKLAGYDGLPLEEVIKQEPAVQTPNSVIRTANSVNDKLSELDDDLATDAQRKMIFALGKKMNLTPEETKDLVKKTNGLDSFTELTKEIASLVIEGWNISIEQIPETSKVRPVEAEKKLAELNPQPKTLDDKIKGSRFDPTPAQKPFLEEDFKDVEEALNEQ